MKYIIINPGGVECAILFPDAITHSQAINQHQAAPLSAGFYSNGVAFGGSDSLGLHSRPQDSETIQFTLRLLQLGSGAQSLLVAADVKTIRANS